MGAVLLQMNVHSCQKGSRHPSGYYRKRSDELSTLKIYFLLGLEGLRYYNLLASSAGDLVAGSLVWSLISSAHWKLKHARIDGNQQVWLIAIIDIFITEMKT